MGARVGRAIPAVMKRSSALKTVGWLMVRNRSWRRTMTLWLNLRLLPRWALTQIQTNRDGRARSIRRKSLLREQELAKHIGYR